MNTRPLHTRSDRRQPEQLSRWRVVFPLLGTVIILLLLSTLAHAQTVTDPGTSGPCTTSSQVVYVNGTLTTTIYYPTNCGTWASAPYPGIAFAHGFSMFGLTDGMADNSGNGQHLASWGYVTAIPRLPDDAETRVTNLRDVLTYLETQTSYTRFISVPESGCEPAGDGGTFVGRLDGAGNRRARCARESRGRT